MEQVNKRAKDQEKKREQIEQSHEDRKQNYDIDGVSMDEDNSVVVATDKRHIYKKSN